MKRPLYGLYVEWSKPQAGYFALTGDEPLSARDLSALEANMLRHNRIPRLLPVEFAEIDGKLKLHFDASGKRPLTRAMRRDSVTPLACYRILYAIASIVEESKLFMLDEEKYVLREEFIFIGKEEADVCLLYIPLETIPGKGGLQEEFRRLTRRLFERVSDFDGYRVNELLDCLKEETFGIAALKRLLLEIMEQLEAAAGNNGRYDEREEEASMPSKGIMQEEAYVHLRGLESENRPPERFATEQGAGGWRGKAMPAIAAIVLLLVWLWYSEEPSDAVLNISIGVTLLCAASYLYFVHIGVVRFPAIGDRAVSGVGSEAGSIGNIGSIGHEAGDSGRTGSVWSEAESIGRAGSIGRSALAGREESADARLNRFDPGGLYEAEGKQEGDDGRGLFGIGDGPRVSSGGGVQGSSRTEQAAERTQALLEEYYGHLSSHTTLLTQEAAGTMTEAGSPGETVLLGQPAMETAVLAPSAILEVQAGDEHVFLPIAGERLVVGRKIYAGGMVLADFEVDAPDVSRQHLAFERNGSEYIVKDLESKNGSYVNGERLFPHREYVLHDGDRIRIATVECVFKNFAACGNNV